MKIGIINDTHDRGKNSINRLGDMHKDFMQKLDETIEIFKDCDFVIHLGDIWDSPNVSNSVIDDWLDRIEESGMKWFIVPGNHDMIGASWETSSSSALAHAFRRSKSIEYLNKIKKDSVYIKGYPYFYDCEKSLKELKHNEKDCLSIACTHAFITKKNFPFATHIKMKDIDTNYDIVLCSHYHTVFDENVNGTRFINLGAWGRLSITEAEHEPRVAILDTKTKNIDVIKLKSSKDAGQIFDLTKIKELKETDKELENFIKSIESAEFQSNNIKDIVSEICDTQKIDKKVKNLLFKKIGG